MCANVAGSRSLNFSGQFDVTQILENQQKVIQGFNAVRSAAEASSSGAGQSNALRQAQLSMQDALRASRLEYTRLSTEVQDLSRRYNEGRIAEQEYRTESARLRVEQQNLAIRTREARLSQVGATGSYREAQLRLTQLGRQIREVAGGFQGLGRVQQARIAEYTRLNAQLTEFDRRMGNNQRNVGNYSSALSGVGNTLANLAAQYLSAMAIVSGFNRVIQNNAQVSDLFSDVQRTAGLTTKEVDALSDSLKKIDTRTSLKGLLDITVIGGQLGIAKDQLLGFVRATDQLAVSLSGELQGGAAGVAKSLGVLSNIFGVTKQEGGDVEKAFNRIGSAILGLGQSGLATGDFLTDFAERVGGVAAQAKIGLPVILSYGAVLQENGVSAEVAGTAFKKLLGSISTKREKFFAVAQIADANLTLKEFTNIINTDTQKALQLFFDGLQKGGPKTTQFLDLLKSVGLDASRAGQTITALARNQESLNKHIQDSTDDYNDASKAAEQFRIKNDNLAASLAKLQNVVVNITTDPNSGIAQWFKNMIDRVREGIITIAEFTNVLRKSRLNTDIELFTKSGQTTFFSKEIVQEEIARRRILEVQKNTNEAVKLGNQLAHDAVIDVKANSDYATRIAQEQAKLAKIRSDISFNENRAGEVNLKKEAELNRLLVAQRIVVQKLKDEFGKRAQGPGVDLVNTKDLDKSARQIESFSEKLTKFHRDATRKQLESDDQEIQSVKDKYTTFREEAAKFYADNAKAVIKFQGKNISKSQVSGILTADEKSEIDAIEKKRRDKVTKQEQEDAEKKYKKLLDDFMDYGQKREKLLSDFNADSLILSNDPRQQAERKKKYESDLKALDEANGKSLDSYEKLFIGIEQLSTRNALKLIQNARVQLSKDIASGAIKDSDEINKIKERFNELEKSIKNGTGEELRKLGGALEDIAGLVGGVDSDFGKLIGTLGSVLSQVGSIKDGIASFKLAQGKDDIVGQLTSGLGIVGAGISIFKSIFSLFDKSKQREEQAAYSRDLQNKQTESLNKILERQISLLDDVYGTERITNYGIALKQAQENELKYQDQLKNRFQLTGDKTVDKFIEELNTTGTVKQLQFMGDKALANFIKTLNVLPTDIEQLQRLLDEGKLDANTSVIVQNLIKANESAIELANNLRKEVTGTSLDQIADDFISTLTDGTQDFGKTFEETIQKSIINGFKGEIIRKQLQAFYEQFATLSEGGLTKEEIEVLRQSYITAGEQAKKDIEAIQAITGIDLTGNGNNTPADGIKGKLQRELTESTASEFLGVTRNIYEINVRQLTTMTATMNILNNSVNYLSKIETNTANTVIELQNSVIELKAINANTKGTQATTRDLGL